MIEQKKNDAERRLRKAADDNAVKALREALAAGASIEGRDGSGKTPLHCAARSGARAAVKALLDLRADVNSRDDLGATPVDEAEYWYIKEPKHGDGGKLSASCAEVLDVLRAHGGFRAPLGERHNGPWVRQKLEAAARERGIRCPWEVEGAAGAANALPTNRIKRVRAAFGYAIHGFCMEMHDGSMTGKLFDDEQNEMNFKCDMTFRRRLATDWEAFGDNEVVVKVTGRHSSRGFLVWKLVLHVLDVKSHHMRQISWEGEKASWSVWGDAGEFEFQASLGREIIEVHFANGRCAGIKELDRKTLLPLQPFVPGTRHASAVPPFTPSSSSTAAVPSLSSKALRNQAPGEITAEW